MYMLKFYCKIYQCISTCIVDSCFIITHKVSDHKVVSTCKIKMFQGQMAAQCNITHTTPGSKLLFISVERCCNIFLSHAIHMLIHDYMHVHRSVQTPEGHLSLEDLIHDK